MFRNREIRQFAGLFFLITIMTGAAGMLLICPEAGILIFILAVCYGAAFFWFIRERYKRIARMSEQIDQILHDKDGMYIAEEEEGELSILQSEIGKMTLKIRQQNRALQKEKERLADSLADIAHQLRTPLTSVNLILSLLEKQPEEGRRRALFLEMEDLLVRVDSLITSLLKLSRLDAGIIVLQKEPVEVRALVDTALRPLRISMDLHDVTVRMDLPDGVSLSGDPDWLAQAVQNILKNCMESVGDHGWIEIVCEDTLLFTEIRIHDSGSGFDESELHSLFERFYRGKDTKTSGYGIGLALCKSILTRHGGTVRARNHPEGGAVFLIRFPKDLP